MRRNGNIERSSAFGQFAIHGRPSLGFRWFIEMEMSFAFGERSRICSYMRPGWPSSGPCTVWQNGVSIVAPSASPSIPVWSCTTSNSSALRNACTACCISQYVWPIHSLGAVWKTDSRRARVCESPEAKSVTS